jgi:hypothetical protein
MTVSTVQELSKFRVSSAKSLIFIMPEDSTSYSTIPYYRWRWVVSFTHRPLYPWERVINTH